MFEHRVEMELDRNHTALVLADIQNDFMSPAGLYYPLIEECMVKNKVNDHVEELLKCAKANNFPVLMSPHYFYPHDQNWTAPRGPMEDLALKAGVAYRQSPTSAKGLEGSGADYPERFRPYMEDGQTILTSPHKLFTPTNDMVLQLRKRRIDKVIMAGSVINLCLEGHMRELSSNGFEIALVRDATAGGKNEEGDGYQAGLVNWRYIAHAIWTAEETMQRMRAVAA